MSHKKDVIDIMSKKGRERIVMLALYDYQMAKMASECDVDGILVGDSVVMNVYGFSNTLYATLRDIIRHTQAVANARPSALIVADMPFMTYETSIRDALRNASKLVRAGAEAVKIEGGIEVARIVDALTKYGIPVMGHIGLTPQRVLRIGGYKLMGRTAELGLKLLEDAKALEEAGAFSIVIEFTAAEVAEEITKRVNVPTICIGSGPGCDGQILVVNDILGLSDVRPPFAKVYVDLRDIIVSAIRQYVSEVRQGRFPSEEHCRRMRREELNEFIRMLRERERAISSHGSSARQLSS